MAEDAALELEVLVAVARAMATDALETVRETVEAGTATGAVGGVLHAAAEALDLATRELTAARSMIGRCAALEVGGHARP
jgi:hypothetical protein